ncbi:MAG: Rha family transcriptional regulator [Clostridium argentinense]|nr:Rha family transcriptional regulator [Clostridium argentinense]
MNYLNTFDIYNKQLIDSREVAKIIGKRHDHLLRDIRNYIKVIEDYPTLSSADYFVESTYVNSQNKIQPCYLLTKLGCDMVANKMIGEKGVLFTATYITKFYEMEEQLKLKGLNFTQTYADVLRSAAEIEEIGQNK